MGETLLRVNAVELVTVRIRCKCGKVAEMPVSELARAFRSMQCPFCETSLAVKGSVTENPFVDLQAALETFARAQEKYSVEFSLPVE